MNPTHFVVVLGVLYILTEIIDMIEKLMTKPKVKQKSYRGKHGETFDKG